ncbi:MAG: glycosyltransferase family 9 protein [Nitrospirae bacterium]|nr:glycosyltransferase family 9 protein [Nitrospirota bacterium]
MKEDDTKRNQPAILIIQLGQIGDFVLSSPVFRGVKESYDGKAHITVMTDPVNEALARKNRHVDDVILYNSQKYYRYKSLYLKKLKFPKIALKDRRFDYAIWLRADITTFLWLLKNRIPMRSLTKYPNPLRWAWMPLITGRAVKRRFIHYVECLDDLTGVKVSESACKPEYRPFIWQGDQKVVFIHVSAGSGLRKWSKENFSELCRRLLKWSPDIRINLLGGKTDHEVALSIKEHSSLSEYSDRIGNLCGKIALTELSKALSEGTLYIGFDSGPLHIAASSGIPIVALMGPQSPQLFKPWGKQEIRIIYKGLYCSPCWQFYCFHTASQAGLCISAIQPEEVFNEAKAILSKTL